MKKYIILLTTMLLTCTIAAQQTNQIYLDYIEKYKKEALSQQKKHHIPASITLAQGLLESSAGQSELATKANNHFGIKCTSDWTGDSYRHDDETKQECFRKYRHAEESYEDHSLFLLRARYKMLYELPLTDYKGWARGLKQCGYATDPRYADKLIKIIEDYSLNLITENKETDNKEASDKDKNVVKTQKNSNPNEPQKADADETVEKAFKQKKVQRSMGEVELQQVREVKRENGRKYIIARQGDTFESIAYEFNMYERMLRKYNDIVNPRYELQAGDRVYLQLKRRRAKKEFAVYRVRRNENIWQIAQDKGMRLQTIYKLNGIAEGQNVTINQELRLR